MPSFGMYTVEGTIAAWLAEPGSGVEAGQPIVELSTDKASFEIEAPAAGRFHPVAEIGQTVAIEGLIALVLEEGESAEAALTAARAAPPAAPVPVSPPPVPAAVTAPASTRRENSDQGASAGRINASPMARRLALELGVDLAGVSGSGPDGRIMEADVRAASESGKMG
jgi:pyruvate dehydrogenase E2 component (dihydrolipoamide acetyltransferase)